MRLRKSMFASKIVIPVVARAALGGITFATRSGNYLRRAGDERDRGP